MSEVRRRTTVVTKHEWFVPIRSTPQGVAVGDFLEAVEWARRAYADYHGSIPTFDDWATVTHDDDNIIVFFATSEVEK